MSQFDDHEYEPSREIKLRFLVTHKHDPAIGATPHPGLFQTANVFGDVCGLVLALLLEAYGLYNLMRVGSIQITAALALVAVDIVGALLAHYRQGNLCRIRCLLAVTDPAERARIRYRDRLSDRAIRALGALMIAGSAAWKVASFASIGSLNETPAAIIALMGLVYISAGCLHWSRTGYAIAYAWLMLGLELERRRTLGEDPSTAKCGIHGFRTHTFESRLPLAECTVNGHALIAAGDGRHTLRTAGLLLDHDLATLAAAQDCPETRDTVTREGLQAQLVMLDHEPVRPSSSPAAKRGEKDEPQESQASHLGNGRTAPSFARRAALLLLPAVLAASFSGCGNPPQPKRIVAMKIIVPASALTDEHKLPEALIDLVAPARVSASDGKTPVVVPTVSLFVMGGGEYEPVTITPHADPGLVPRSYGVTATAGQQLASTRRQLFALKLEPISTSAAGAPNREPVAAAAVEDLVLDTEGKPQGKPLAFEPGAVDALPPPVIVGHAEVPAFGDPAEMGRVIAEAAASGESKFTVLYGMTGWLTPPPVASAPAETPESMPVESTEPPAARQEARSEVLPPSKPRIVALSENYSHAALVDHAESQLVVRFNPGSSELSFEAVKAIERLAGKAAAIGNSTGQWIVIGYADGKGKMEDNDHLSLDRGLRTAAEMGSCGMPVAVVAGAGVTRPAAPNETPDGRAENRRVIVYWKSSTAGN